MSTLEERAIAILESIRDDTEYDTPVDDIVISVTDFLEKEGFGK
jgi:hypothetical protein